MARTAAEHSRNFEKQQRRRMITILPPEGVPIGLEKASMGTRFGAQIIDLLLTYGTLIGLLLLVGWNLPFSWETMIAFFALLSFLCRIPYYILTELVWNGRTIGKRIVKIRVVSSDGRRLEPHQVVVRNLMKEAEVFTPISLLFGIVTSTGLVRWLMALWLLAVILVPIINRRNQRLGDMVAGTYVVVQPQIKKAVEVTEAAKRYSDDFTFTLDQLEVYGRFELQSLEKILRDKGRKREDWERDKDVAQAIRKKIGYVDPISGNDSRPFLMAFYNAQRAHLEQRRILGDKREDKHHAKDRR